MGLKGAQTVKRSRIDGESIDRPKWGYRRLGEAWRGWRGWRGRGSSGRGLITCERKEETEEEEEVDVKL